MSLNSVAEVSSGGHRFVEHPKMNVVVALAPQKLPLMNRNYHNNDNNRNDINNIYGVLRQDGLYTSQAGGEMLVKLIECV